MNYIELLGAFILFSRVWSGKHSCERLAARIGEGMLKHFWEQRWDHFKL